MRRTTGILLLALAMAPLAGCDEPIVLSAWIIPEVGHVPYEANLVCTPLAGTYTVRLPDGTTLVSEESEIPVIVDLLDWAAEVTWSDGRDVRNAVATARGSNARPTIWRPRLNGDPYLWALRPHEKTLIDFSHVAGGLSGPSTGVHYDGVWRLVEVRVEAEAKVVCGAPMGDSIYTPPWEEDVLHAEYGGRIVDHAVLVYPLLTMETHANGRPYAPAAMTGYPYDPYTQRNVLLGVQFPEQTATIYVAVEDEWGRVTRAAFEIPVGATSTWTPDLDADHHHTNPVVPDKPETFAGAAFFVSGTRDATYHRRDCPEVCGIPGTERLYYASEANAEAAGKRRCPSCFEY
ncbi:MAG: hypothetical protein AB1778_10265 [Candidatus Bipolaricaulota bacterium]